jgi:hypothetical protein
MTYGPWSLLTDAGLIGGLLLVGALVRRWVGVAQRLMLPASVIAGFLGLLLGPKVLGVLPFSDQLGTYASVLIAMIFACLALSDDMGSRRLLRSNRIAPSRRSIFVIAWLSAGWAICRSRAASVMLRRSATARKYWSCRSSTVTTRYPWS